MKFTLFTNSKQLAKLKHLNYKGVILSLLSFLVIQGIVSRFSINILDWNTVVVAGDALVNLSTILTILHHIYTQTIKADLYILSSIWFVLLIIFLNMHHNLRQLTRVRRLFEKVNRG